jgi:hypothetical protein
MVQLPKPLQPGEEHRYGLSLRMPRHMLRLPRTVRFDPALLPQWIRRVDGETVRTCEVHQEFRDLALYLGYGIQWAPAG